MAEASCDQKTQKLIESTDSINDPEIEYECSYLVSQVEPHDNQVVNETKRVRMNGNNEADKRDITNDILSVGNENPSSSRDETEQDQD